MRSVVDWYDRNRRSIWLCIVLNLLLLLIYLLLMRPVFDSNDDMNIAFFVNMARPIQDPYLLFENVLLGHICSFLYRVTNMLPWYGLLQYFGLFCAFTGMTWVIQQLFSTGSAAVLSLVFLNFFAADAYIQMQFTKTAGVCAACGLCLVVYAMTRRHVHRIALLAGVLITLYGYLYRDREAYVMIALWCVLGFTLLLRLNEVKPGRRLHRAQAYFGCLFLVVVLCGGAWTFNKVSYRLNPEASAYKAINDVRSDITDYGFPDYAQNRELFDSLGISANAYKLFSKWNFYDPDVYTLKVQEKILEAQPDRELNMQLVKDFLDKYPYKWFENPMFYCFLTMAVLALLYGKRDWKMWLTLVLLILALTGVFFIMYWNGRYNLQRVDSPIWLCASLILLFLTDPEKFVLPARFALTLVLVLLVLNQDNWRANWRHNTRRDAEKMASNANLAAQTSLDKEHLYLTKVGLYTLSVGYGPLSLVPVGVGANTCTLGGWPAGSPSYCAVLKSYGIENPYRDCINNDKVYLIDNHIDWTMNYIHEYYDPDAQEEVIGTFGEDTVYRIVSNKVP